MTSLSYECNWTSSIVLDNWISPNNYNCEFYFEIETDDGDQQNKAFDRCKIFIENILNESLFINIKNPLLPTLAKKTQQRIVTFASEPLDIIVAATVYQKLNAITEGRLSVQKVKIRSQQGENLWVHFDIDFAKEFTNLDCDYYNVQTEKPWWFRPDASTGDWFEFNNRINSCYNTDIKIKCI